MTTTGAMNDCDDRQHDPQTNKTDEAYWRAWRYAAGEMTDAERAAFETAMGSDPSIAPMVAQAFGDLELVAAAIAEDPRLRADVPGPSSQTTPHAASDSSCAKRPAHFGHDGWKTAAKRLSLTAVAASAALFLGLAYWPVFTPPTETPRVAARRDARPAPQVALAPIWISAIGEVGFEPAAGSAGVRGDGPVGDEDLAIREDDWAADSWRDSGDAPEDPSVAMPAEEGALSWIATAVLSGVPAAPPEETTP